MQVSLMPGSFRDLWHERIFDLMAEELAVT